jgi:hypothetical protein
MTEIIKEKIYIAIDVEFEGENVISDSCLQFACIAFRENLSNPLDRNTWYIDSISICFERDPYKKQNINVMEFWSKFLDIKRRIIEEAKPIPEQMYILQKWLNKLNEEYTFEFVSDIACVDYSWIKNYIHEYCNEEERNFRLPYKCLCLYSIQEAIMSLGYTYEEIKGRCSTSIFPHTHYALDDCYDCVYYYLNLKIILNEIKTKM